MYIVPAFGCDAMTKVLPFILPSIITIVFYFIFSIVNCLGIHNHLYL